MIYHSKQVPIIIPEPRINPILCHNSNLNSNPSSTPNPPFKAKPKHTTKLSKLFAQLLQTVLDESQAISYFYLHVILSPNTNQGRISILSISPTLKFLPLPIFCLPCICSCSPVPLWLPILCIYLHIS